MSLSRMSHSARPNTKRTILRVEHLDDLLMPSFGVISLSFGVAWTRDLFVEAVSVESSAGPECKPTQRFATGHIEEYGSKPGGTGEGVFGLILTARIAELELKT